MAEEATRKKRIRAGHRGSTTKLLTRIDGVLSDSPTNEDNLTQLKTCLSEKLETLRLLDSEVVDLIPEEELAADIEQADEFKQNVYLALTRVDKALRAITTTSTSRPPPPGTAPTPAHSHPPSHKVKLPKITLPHFSGNVMKWPAFWDSYESAVDSNPDLSDVDKFNYLRSLLERSAYEAIAGMTLSSGNYVEAVDILKKRFGNKQLIISKHMETLLGVEAVGSDQNLRGLRRLYDEVESHIRSLKALGVGSESYGTMLASVLLNKLPPDVRLIISRKTRDADPDIGTLLQTLEEELVSRERTFTATRPTPRRPPEGGRSTATTLLTGNLSTTPRCCYCQQTHPSVECSTVTSASARKQILRTSGRCFNCLRKGHLGRNCRSPGKCTKCKARHHSSICENPELPPSDPVQRTPVQPPASPLNPEAPSFTSVPTSSNMCSSNVKTVLLQTARASVYNVTDPRCSTQLRLLLDSGSQRSYLSERARSHLGLEPIAEQELSIATFGSSRERHQSCPVVKVGMRVKGYSPLHLSLFVVPVICEPLISQPIIACVQEHSHLASLELADHSDGDSTMEVDMLIGSDFYWDLVTGGVSRGAQGPVAVHTKLGWVLSGPTPAEGVTKHSTNLVTTHVLRVDAQPSEFGCVEAQLRSFWELESLGIGETEKTLYDDFLSSVTVRDGRYEVSLPWRDMHDPLPDNYRLSFKRLQGLLHRLKQSPDILSKYDGIIREQVEQGIIETVPRENSDRQCHYLPHHAIVRSDKATTKIRIVYDASAKSDGPSLNDCLQKGPKFNQLIFDILLRFRVYKFALIADLEKAFLQISVASGDRDVLRFLWVDDLRKEHPEVQAFRFTRVMFGVSSSPFLLNATLKYHLEQFANTYPNLVKCLLESTYVDDVITGADTEDEAFDLYTQAKGIFRRGKFNLRKFATNSPQLQHRIDLAEKSRAPSPHGAEESHPGQLDETYGGVTFGDKHGLGAEQQKVLGVCWTPRDDCLTFDVSLIVQLADTLEPTKRNVISIISKFYDPLGFLAPVIIRFKVFFQKLCGDRVDWDEPLSEELETEWKTLVSTLRGTTPIHIPRRYITSEEAIVSQHVYGFCDASVQAYAAVVYLVVETEESRLVSFVAAKTRVAPLKTQTIPRLELLSAVLLSRLVTAVLSSLESVLSHLELHCFTDSQVALYWIQGTDREWRPFVQNRVIEIRRRVPPDRWSHCPGVTNPADLPSRGLSLLELSVSKLWHRGPEWLNATYPSHDEDVPVTMPEECVLELKRNQPTHNLVAMEARPSVGSMMHCERYGTLSRLLRVTACVIRAGRQFKNQSPLSPVLSPDELMEAERLWIVEMQSTLVADKNFPSWRHQLDLFVDDKGVWRCGGRLDNADIPYTTKHPVLLPRDHHITALIVKDAHERVGHDGVKETLTETRTRFWIVKGRNFVRSLIHRCVTCRRFEGAPFRGPPPPPLPTFRVKEEPPFSFTGVDFAGPLHIRPFALVRSDKVWICLFTCLVTRAVHLDVTTDLSTETFIRCLKRFAARRGLPRKFLSDNGKTFKAAARFIKAIFRDEMVQDYLAGRGVDWMFNIEKAPWWGGAFERMVKSTKRCLRKMVGRSRLSLDELQTALVEIESIINSRPLSYISSDDREEPLTPSHLLTGRRVLNLPDHLGYRSDPDDDDFTLDSTGWNKRLRRLNESLNHFWIRWRREYLIELREAHRQSKRRSAADDISVGDVVVVHDESLPRGLWRLGRVEQLIPGRDEKVRGAVVRVSSGGRQSSSLRRPVQLLYPLEAHDNKSLTEDMSGDDHPNCPSQSADVGKEVQTTEAEVGPAKRPQRAAGFRARDYLKALAMSESEFDS